MTTTASMPPIRMAIRTASCRTIRRRRCWSRAPTTTSAIAAGAGRGAEVERRVASGRSFKDIAKSATAVVLLAALGSLTAWQWPNIVGVYRTVTAPKPEAARVEQPKQGPRKITDRHRASERKLEARCSRRRWAPLRLRRRLRRRSPRRSCFTRRTRTTRKASAMSGRRSGAPSACPLDPISRRKSRSAPTSKSPTASSP